MRTGSIRVGDLVKCDIGGRVFFAEVQETRVHLPGMSENRPNGIRFKPITPNITFRTCRGTQIVGHYAKRTG